MSTVGTSGTGGGFYPAGAVSLIPRMDPLTASRIHKCSVTIT
jgi:hypothetical protein